MRQPFLRNDPGIGAVSLRTLVGIASAIEREAVARYDQLAQAMRRRGEPATAAALRAMRDEESGHVVAVEQWAAVMGEPVPAQRFEWRLPEELAGAWDEAAGSALLRYGLPAVVPMAIAIVIAVLRYRLYDIDRVVSRTVTYGLVLVVLAGVYVGVVAGLAALVPADLGQVGVAVATLVVSVLAVPLTRRVRAVVDEDGGGGFCRADAVAVLSASPDRVAAPCSWAWAGGCGGCDLQHVAPAAQRAWKAQVLAEQLRRLAGVAFSFSATSVSASAQLAGCSLPPLRI